MSERSVADNPMPGDVTEARGFRFVVVTVASGQVYVAKYANGSDEPDLIRVGLDVWRKGLAGGPDA